MSPAELMAMGATHVTSDSITLHLEGTIGAIPYNLDLSFSLDLPNSELMVTLHVTQPVPYQGSWTFHLDGLLPGGSPTAAAQPTGLSASLVSTSLPQLSGTIGCIVKCLGPEVIVIVLQCLPSLATGKQAFLNCLIQNAEASSHKPFSAFNSANKPCIEKTLARPWCSYAKHHRHRYRF